MPSARTLLHDRDRHSHVLVCFAWLLASLGTAVIAHTVIGFFGAAGFGGDAFAEHAHGTVVPIGFGAVALTVALLLRSAAIGIGRARAVDPAVLLARRFGTMAPLVPVLAVALGGFVCLLAMEFAEQAIALGHVEGGVAALGGNVGVGLAIIASTAIVLTVAGLRSATALLRVSRLTMRALCGWIGVAVRRRAKTVAPRRAPLCRVRARANARFVHALGLRAPPTSV